jgi:hypothetical protein
MDVKEFRDEILFTAWPPEGKVGSNAKSSFEI